MRYKTNTTSRLADLLLGVLFIAFFIGSALCSLPSKADTKESIPFREYQDEMRQEGQVLSIHLSMGNPIRIFVVGKEEAKIDLSKVQLTVRRLDPYPGKVLKLDRYDNYFVIKDKDDFNKNTALEINAKIDTTNENFKFKLKSKIP